jgi:lysophospholipase L1-like esterase
MQQILVYADSLSWGIVPGTRERLPFEERWPGVMENALHASGLKVRVIEDCLNGRRTVWDDAFKPGRNGLEGIGQRIEVNSPLSLVILMLGTNDFQFSHPHNNAWSAGRGIAALVEAIRRAPIEPGMPVPPVMIVCPPLIVEPKGEMAEKFHRGDERCVGLSGAYKQVASELDCQFFDAGTLVMASKTDGVHLDKEAHAKLGKALAEVVKNHHGS